MPTTFALVSRQQRPTASLWACKGWAVSPKGVSLPRAPPLTRAGSSWCVGRAVCAAALGCLSCASGGFCLSVRVVGSWGVQGPTVYLRDLRDLRDL